MKTRNAMRGLVLFVIGGACGWGLSALAQVEWENNRVRTLRTADASAALPAGLDLLENGDGLAALVSALEDSGAPAPVPAANRKTVANALGGYQGFLEPLRALSQCAVDDPDAQVRLECVRLIISFTHDRFFAAVRKIAKSLPTEADAQVMGKKRRLLTMAAFADEGEALTDQLSNDQLSRQCRLRLGESLGETNAESDPAADGLH